MKPFANVLCVVDLTQEEHPALSRAIWFAEHSNARLTLFVCYYNEYLSSDRFFHSKALRRARDEVLEGYRRKLEEIAAPLRASGMSVETSAVWDHPLPDSIVRQASEVGADIVFKETDHRSSLSISFFGNNDWELLRTCPLPLWMVNSREISSNPVVVAAIDPLNEHDKPATLDDKILSVGRSVASSVGGNLHAFHSFDPRLALSGKTDAYLKDTLSLDDIQPQVRQEHEQRFDQITRQHGIPKDRSHLMAGLPHEELPLLVDELDAGLVVMGAVSRNRLERLFIGATAERLIDRLSCDLLVVKPRWFETPVKTKIDAAA